MELRETTFKAWVNKHWPKNTQVTNIESYTKPGIPDTFVQVPGCIGLWIEFKVNEDSTMPLMRKEQRIWGIKNAKAKGKALVVLFNVADDTCYIFSHPINLVEVTGKYLRVRDLPIEMVPKLQLNDYLITYSKQ